MDFRLTEDLELWRKTVREFTENEMAPHDEAMDRANDLSWDIIAKMRMLACSGIPYPEEYGDLIWDPWPGYYYRGVARGSASVALTLDAHWLATDPFTFLALRSKKEVFA